MPGNPSHVQLEYLPFGHAMGRDNFRRTCFLGGQLALFSRVLLLFLILFIIFIIITILRVLFNHPLLLLSLFYTRYLYYSYPLLICLSTNNIP